MPPMDNRHIDPALLLHTTSMSGMSSTFLLAESARHYSQYVDNRHHEAPSKEASMAITMGSGERT